MKQEKMMTIQCASCGAPAQFDIVTQNYRCPSCGGITGTDIPLKKLQEFRSLTQTLLKEKLPESQTVACDCPNCGARVIMKAHEVTETCMFCQSKLVRADVQMGEGFPEVVIPFKLNRKEAEKRLEEWIEKNSDKEEAKLLKENKNKLKGIYLPYELIRGPIRFIVSRDNSERRYECGGYLDHVAVNVTERCNNLLLHGMEPFLWEDLEPFQFGYIAGHAAEVPTADGEELRRRVFEEMAEDYRPTVERTMQTTGLALHPSSEALLRLPAFLPVYFLDCKEVQAAVNGQTGKVSVLAEKETKTYPWVIEPLIGTLAVMGGTFAFFRNFRGTPMDMLELLKLTGMMGLIAALILFSVFSEGRKARVRRKIFKSISEEENSSFKLFGKKKRSEKSGQDTMEPVFFETVNGQEIPVQLGFYSGGRIVKMALMLLLVNASPIILAWLITAWKSIRTGNWMLFQQLDYSYNIVWSCLSVPISFAGFLVFGRIEIYDAPVIYQLLENGGRRRIDGKLTANNRPKKTLRMRCMAMRESAKEKSWVLGLIGPMFIPILLFLMTTYMIMNP